MEQAKYSPCPSCQAPIPTGHKFCGRCGETTPPEILEPQTDYFGDLQDPSKASLVVIRGLAHPSTGETQDGLSYHLRASEHIVGRQGQIQFDDPFLSPRHANLYYHGSQLTLRDEKSTNGTYLRIRGKTKIAMGDTFIAGEQLFRVEPMPTVTDEADATGTYFYASPVYECPFRVVQLLRGGAPGLTHCPRGSRVTVGRQGCDINVDSDRHLSIEHCVLEQDSDGFSLTDLDSRNGTYIRIKSDHAVDHGDYLMMGKEVLRVELNA